MYICILCARSSIEDLADQVPALSGPSHYLQAGDGASHLRIVTVADPEHTAQRRKSPSTPILPGVLQHVDPNDEPFTMNASVPIRDRHTPAAGHSSSWCEVTTAPGEAGTPVLSSATSALGKLLVAEHYSTRVGENHVARAPA